MLPDAKLRQMLAVKMPQDDILQEMTDKLSNYRRKKTSRDFHFQVRVFSWNKNKEKYRFKGLSMPMHQSSPGKIKYKQIDKLKIRHPMQ